MNGAVNQLPEFGSDDFEKCCIISEKRNFALLVIFHLYWSTYFQIIANDDPKPVNPGHLVGLDHFLKFNG